MLNDKSTIKDLADALAETNASIRMRAQRTRGGTRFLVSVQYPGGTAMFSNLSLGGVLDASIAFLTMHESAPEVSRREVAEAEAASVVSPREVVEADPDGAHVGPAPRPDPTGTNIGYVPTPLHCAVCGYGENEGEEYSPSYACDNCRTVGHACPMEPNHESNHLLREESGENAIRS